MPPTPLDNLALKRRRLRLGYNRSRTIPQLLAPKTPTPGNSLEDSP